ncbi:hypothetical protein E2562_021241 [Oryza meyeriana var. granulata]|uniref:Uncharacterized protein n=1 Tax=Oryza meyeriana var. granulata TaxID=110450 RepID=A0A6G1E040_9ORYZ|nr:hypothetical protein E2562_021241 [Oryza meyeriana var. granulata]
MAARGDDDCTHPTSCRVPTKQPVAIGVHLQASSSSSLQLPLLVVALVVLCLHTDTLTVSRPLTGDQKLVSERGKFVLGFFQPQLRCFGFVPNVPAIKGEDTGLAAISNFEFSPVP